MIGAWIGSVLPDLIDKPLFYFFRNEFITGTRTVAHTFLFVIFLLLLAIGFRARKVVETGVILLLGLALGVVSHLGLDLFSSWWITQIAPPPPGYVEPGPSTAAAVFFPLYGPHFPIYPFQGVRDHAAKSYGSPLILFEVFSFLYLAVRLTIFGYSRRRGQKSKAAR